MCQDDTIRIYHFVSDSNRGQENIRCKFDEAEDFYRQHALCTDGRGAKVVQHL